MKKREILFSAVLTGVLLAGCGNSGTKETVGPANGAQETQIENQIENEDNVQNEDIKDIAERIQKSYDISFGKSATGRLFWTQWNLLRLRIRKGWPSWG